MSERDEPASALPWQSAAWAQIVAMVSARRVPHAVLLTGMHGVGKTQFCRALVHYAMCQQPLDGRACGECHSCRLSIAGVHPDVRELSPEPKSQVIKIDQVREASDFVQKTAAHGGRKVVILRPAEQMNTYAANAFLKTLEEPPGDALLVLVSDVPGQLIATIRSRCYRLDLPLPAEAEVVAWLQSWVGKDEAAELARMARGVPLVAKSLLDVERAQQRKTLLSELCGLAVGQLGVAEVAARWAKNDLSVAFEALLYWLHLGLLSKVSGQTAAHPERVELEQMFAHAGTKALYRLFDKTVYYKRRWVQGINYNKQLVIDDLLLDWRGLASNSRGLYDA